MATKELTKAALAESTVNCCNGRVGKRMLELAQENEAIRQAIIPTGIELLRQAAQAGRSTGDTVNCCNGRVGSALNLKELATELGGAGQSE